MAKSTSYVQTRKLLMYSISTKMSYELHWVLLFSHWYNVGVTVVFPRKKKVDIEKVSGSIHFYQRSPGLPRKEYKTRKSHGTASVQESRENRYQRGQRHMRLHQWVTAKRQKRTGILRRASKPSGWVLKGFYIAFMTEKANSLQNIIYTALKSWRVVFQPQHRILYWVYAFFPFDSYFA